MLLAGHLQSGRVLRVRPRALIFQNTLLEYDGREYDGSVIGHKIIEYHAQVKELEMVDEDQQRIVNLGHDE